jgi:DNA-binding transcriptional regulator YdaS (Cro superfamily)
MMFRMPNLRAQTLARAATILGGVDALAERLGVAPGTLSMLIRGEASAPPEMFLVAIDIITDAGLADAMKGTPPPKEEEKRFP